MTTYRKPWVQRHWILVLLLSLGLMTLLGLASSAIAIYSMVSAAKTAPPYVEAMKRARTSSELAAVLGQPVKDEWWAFGGIERQEDQGKAFFFIPVTGPKGRAQVHVDAKLEDNAWTYKILMARIEGSNEVIDLR